MNQIKNETIFVTIYFTNMKKTPLISALLVAIAASGITWLFATEKGANLRKKIATETDDFIKQLFTQFNKGNEQRK
jgi:N-formylglutamate amidohydrolase